MPISVDVHLLTGRTTSSLEVEADESVATLTERARGALGVGKGRLLNSSGEVLDAGSTIKRARLQNGDRR